MERFRSPAEVETESNLAELETTIGLASYGPLVRVSLQLRPIERELNAIIERLRNAVDDVFEPAEE